MLLIGHLWTKFACWTQVLMNSGLKFCIYAAGVMAQCGFIWLNIGTIADSFASTSSIYRTPLRSRNWKCVQEINLYIFGRAIQTVQFIGGCTRLIYDIVVHRGHFIWINMVNLPHAPRSSKLKVGPGKQFLHFQQCAPKCWLWRGSP